jgi:ATP-dependent Zn protease
MGDIPEVAISATSETGTGGFVIRTGKERPIQKERLMKLLAFHLGGYVAEKIIFGDENLTTGSSSDLLKASSLAKDTISDCGFEVAPAMFETKNKAISFGVIDHEGELDKLTLKYLQDAEALAKSTLTKERALLLHISSALFKKGTLNQKEIASIVRQHAQNSLEEAQIEVPFKLMLEEQFNDVNPLQKVA